METLNLLVTEERLADIDLLTYYNLEKTPSAPIDFVAHFVTDGKGNFLPKSEALVLVLTGRKLKDVKELAEQLEEKISEVAVPKK